MFEAHLIISFVAGLAFGPASDAPAPPMPAPGEPAEPASDDAVDDTDASGDDDTDASGDDVANESGDEANRREAAQREDWRKGLQKGFVFEFKHGSKLQLGALLTGQGNLSVDQDVGADAGFALVHARTQIAASFFDERLQVVVQPELAGPARLLDAEVSARFDPNFGVRMGFYRPFFMRDFRVNIPMVALPTRGFVHDHFTTGRRLGVAIEGSPVDGMFEYFAGVYNGNAGDFSGAQAANALFLGRVAFNPLGPTPYTQTPQIGDLDGTRVSVAMNVSTERAPLVESPPEGTKAITTQRTTFAADATVMSPKGWLSVTGVRRWHPALNGPSGSFGGYVMGGVPLGDSIFDLTARSGVIDENRGPARGQHEGAVNAYVVGNNLRVSVAYLCERQRGFGAGCQTHTFTTQARLVF